jgi:hypothetical protein
MLTTQTRNKVHPKRIFAFCASSSESSGVQIELAAYLEGAQGEGVGFWRAEGGGVAFYY